MQLGRRDVASSLKPHTIVKCAYQGDTEEDYYPGWCMTEPNEEGCVDVLHFNDKVSRQPDWSRNVPIGLVTITEGSVMGPPTEEQLKGIWRDLTKKQKELAKQVPIHCEDDENSDGKTTPEKDEVLDASRLTDNEGEELVESFPDGGEDVRNAEDQKVRDLQDGMDGCDRDRPDDETDEFTTFSSMELKRVARKLGVAQTGTKKDLRERIRPAWQLKYPDFNEICDRATGLPEVNEPFKVGQPDFDEVGEASGGSDAQGLTKPQEGTKGANEAKEQVSLHKLRVIVYPRNISLFATQFVTCRPPNE